MSTAKVIHGFARLDGHGVKLSEQGSLALQLLALEYLLKNAPAVRGAFGSNEVNLLFLLHIVGHAGSGNAVHAFNRGLDVLGATVGLGEEIVLETVLKTDCNEVVSHLGFPSLEVSLVEKMVLVQLERKRKDGQDVVRIRRGRRDILGLRVGWRGRHVKERS